jgi:hypothetical protein
MECVSLRGTGWKALYAKSETGKGKKPDLRNVPDSDGTGMTERTTIVKMQEIYAGSRHGVFADARSKHTISRYKDDLDTSICNLF